MNSHNVLARRQLKVKQRLLCNIPALLIKYKDATVSQPDYTDVSRVRRINREVEDVKTQGMLCVDNESLPVLLTRTSEEWLAFSNQHNVTLGD
jgi:hypothetical protein